jgi:hypothetical protein
LEKGGEVVAEIGEDAIRVRDIQSRIRDLSFERRAEANDTAPAKRIEVRRSILKEMVAENIMLLEAQDRGFVVSDEEIDGYLDTQEKQEEAAARQEDVDAAAPSRRHKHEGHADWEVEQARADLLREKLKIEDLSSLALRKYYDEHIDEYRLESPFMGCEILAVAVGPSSALVDDVYEYATEKNITLLKAYETVGRSRKILLGGFTPTVPIDTFSDSMRKSVEHLERGDVSKPFVFDRNGKEYYAVVKVATLKKNAPFSTIREEIEQKVYAELIQSLAEKFGVVYYEDKLDYRIE